MRYEASSFLRHLSNFCTVWFVEISVLLAPISSWRAENWFSCSKEDEETWRTRTLAVLRGGLPSGHSVQHIMGTKEGTQWSFYRKMEFEKAFSRKIFFLTFLDTASERISEVVDILFYIFGNILFMWLWILHLFLQRKYWGYSKDILQFQLSFISSWILQYMLPFPVCPQVWDWGKPLK